MSTRPSLASALAIAAAVALQGAAPGGPAVQAQAPPSAPPGQRVEEAVEVRLVEVDAIVTDAQGRPVRDLRREDFEVLEDGHPQQVTNVSFVEVPIVRAESRTRTVDVFDADVQTNVRQLGGRAFVLVLDDLHTAAYRAPFVKAAARRFVHEHLGPTDLAAVIHTSGTAGADQPFTPRRDLLLSSIDRFVGRKLPSETLQTLEEYNRQLTFGRAPNSNVADPDESARATDARRSFAALVTAARRAADVKGRRKSLLWFGEGVDYDAFAPSARIQASIVRDGLRAAIAAATRANVAIYAIDPRGLEGLGVEAIQVTRTPDDPTSSLGVVSLQRELQRSQQTMRSLAVDTGGFAVLNGEELAGALGRVVEDTSAYYLLGYVPTNERLDGTFRTIEVRVKRPGLEVRARRGYIAAATPGGTPTTAPAGPAARLRDALTDPMPERGLPMAAHAAAFRAGDGAALIVTVQYGAEPFRDAAGAAPDDVQLQAELIAVDASGRTQQGERFRIGPDLSPAVRDAVQAVGVRTISRLPLPHGRYQLRVAGLLPAIGAVGSLRYDVEVPDFDDGPIAMSGLLLTSASSALVPTSRAAAAGADALPGPPTTLRAFRADDTISVYAEVYRRRKGRPEDLVVTTTVRSEDGRVVLEVPQNAAAAGAAPAAKHGTPYLAHVPLGGFAPGAYLLQVRATAGADRADRELAFVVMGGDR